MLESAKGAAARRQTVEELRSSLGGALDTAPVLREMLESAKGAAARRQTVEELRSSLGGALDTVPVLREMLESAKGAAARRQTIEELRSSLGGALDTAPVLRELLSPFSGCLISTFLFSVTLSAAADAPTAADQQRILDQVRQYAGRYLETLPNFVCSRVTEQFQAGKKPEHWKQGDTLTGRLVFNQGKENETLELVNGKPIPPGHFISRPLSSEVEFGGLVSGVLDANANAQFSWSRWEALRGRRLAVFEYLVAQDHSHVSVGLNGRAITVPLRGSIYVDPETGELWRITGTPFDIPDGLETKSIETAVDYGPVDISNKQFILPVSASVLLDTGKKNLLNKVSFNQYRKFEAESKITFVSGSN
jgi:hypothetical protein